MSFYIKSAEIIQKLLDRQASIKTLILGDGKLCQKKKYYAFVIQVLKCLMRTLIFTNDRSAYN